MKIQIQKIFPPQKNDQKNWSQNVQKNIHSSIQSKNIQKYF